MITHEEYLCAWSAVRKLEIANRYLSNGLMMMKK